MDTKVLKEVQLIIKDKQASTRKSKTTKNEEKNILASIGRRL
jgi:hypothetical protein